MKTTRFSVVGIAVLALTAILSHSALPSEGTLPPPIPRTKDISYYTGLVNTVLPSFSSSMITVPNGIDWMAGKTVHDVATAMQDLDPGVILTGGSVIIGYDPPHGPRFIKLDFGDGYVRYNNQTRAFRAGLPCTALPATAADAAIVATANALGIPTTEWDARTSVLVMERGVDGEEQDPTPERICEVERMATMTRKAANGYPIFDSMVRESLSNANERARLLVDWPRFVMQTNINMRTRDEVVNDLAQQILDAESNGGPLGAAIDLEIRLGYARTPEGYLPVARAAFLDIYARYTGHVIDVPVAFNQTSGAEDAPNPTIVQFRVRLDPAGGKALADFYLPQPEAIRLTAVDVAGRELATVAEGSFTAGWHQTAWDLGYGTDRRASSGVYFLKLQAGREAPIRKLVVIR